MICLRRTTLGEGGRLGSFTNSTQVEHVFGGQHIGGRNSGSQHRSYTGEGAHRSQESRYTMRRDSLATFGDGGFTLNGAAGCGMLSLKAPWLLSGRDLAASVAQ